MTAASVTERLGMAPDNSHEVGEVNPRNRRSWEAAQWSLTSTMPESEPLGAHLAQLLDRVEPVARLLNALHEEGLSMDWFCFVHRDNGQGGLSFTPRPLRRLGALPANLELDVYRLGKPLRGAATR